MALPYYFYQRVLFFVLAYFYAGLYFALGADDHEAAVGIFSAENHALAFDALEFAWWEVGDKAHFLANQVGWLVEFGDTAHDGAAAHAVVNLELKQLVGLLHL